MNYSNIDSPEGVAKIFTEAWNRRDAEKLAAVFDADAEFINVTGLWWHNRQDIEKAHTYGLSTILKDSTLRLLRTKTKYLADHIAIVQAKMKLSGQTSHGSVKHPTDRTTIFTFVVHKQQNQWSCASAQNTDVVPNMETHIRNASGRLKAVDYRKSKI